MATAKKTPSKATSDAIRHGYRSGLEEVIARQLTIAGIPSDYEGVKLPYTRPEKVHHYTPDFVFPGTNIVVESKGRFVTADRQKQLLIKAQHPHLDIRFVFSNSRARLSKLSQTTYGDWCRKHGFLYADRIIPQAWLDEIRAASLKDKT